MFAAELVLGFEKFFPKSEESTGVNKSAEGEEGFESSSQHALSASAAYDWFSVAV